MSFLSCEEMLAAARSQKITLAEAVLRSDLEESRLTEEQSRAAMHHLWQVMQATSREYDPVQRSRSGLSGGDAAKVEQAHKEGKLLGGDYLSAVTAEALKTAECNACMKRIVAAPTAGSCGVLPAVLLPLARAGEADEEAVCEALYVAAGFGQVIAARATLAGAEGGCQAEVGAASAMAAAALCSLKGGTPEQCAAAAAMALGNLLGLVCDPVAGLVEVPCVKRNVIGAMDARRQQVYNALFKAENGRIIRLCDDRAVSCEYVAQELRDAYPSENDILIVGDGAELLYKHLQAFGIPCRMASPLHRYQRAAGAALAAEALAAQGRLCSAQELQPVYLRLSQAERERLAKGLPLTAE